MDACILVIGDELLTGSTKDKNAGWLAERLDRLGYRLRRIVILPDDPEAIVEEADRALKGADLVVATGGLGPTHDDRTTETLARRFERRPVVDEEGWMRLMERYGKRIPNPSEEQLEATRKMVTIPEGAVALPNPVGASSGYVLGLDREKRVIVLPGVPAELKAMWTEGVEGGILQPLEAPAAEEVDVRLPEAAFAKMLERVQGEVPGVAIGSYPHHGEHRTTIRVRGRKDAVEAVMRRLRDEFGESALEPG